MCVNLTSDIKLYKFSLHPSCICPLIMQPLRVKCRPYIPQGALPDSDEDL